MYDTILVPTDGSRLAERAATREVGSTDLLFRGGEAATHAFEFAGRFDATVHVVSVVPPDRDRSGAEDAVAAAAERAGERSLPVETAVVEGVPYRLRRRGGR